MPSPLRRWRRRSGPSRGVSPRSRPGDAGRAPSLALWALANPRRRPPPGQHRGETAILGAGAWSPYRRSHSSRSPTGRGLIRCRRVRNSTHAAPLTGLPLRASRFPAACPRSPGLTAALRFTKAPTEPTGGVPTKPAWWGAPGEYLARLIAAFSSRWWRAPTAVARPVLGPTEVLDRAAPMARLRAGEVPVGLDQLRAVPPGLVAELPTNLGESRVRKSATSCPGPRQPLLAEHPGGVQPLHHDPAVGLGQPGGEPMDLVLPDGGDVR